MRHRLGATSLAVMCVLAASAGCGSASGSNGSGALTTVPTTPVTGATTPPATTKAPTTATPTTKKPPASSWPTPEDCVSYNPDNVTVPLGLGGGQTSFTVKDGNTTVMHLYGQSDDVAKQGLGSPGATGNTATSAGTTTASAKGDYIFDYWRNPTGQTTTSSTKRTSARRTTITT